MTITIDSVTATLTTDDARVLYAGLYEATGASAQDAANDFDNFLNGRFGAPDSAHIAHVVGIMLESEYGRRRAHEIANTWVSSL